MAWRGSGRGHIRGAVRKRRAFQPGVDGGRRSTSTSPRCASKLASRSKRYGPQPQHAEKGLKAAGLVADLGEQTTSWGELTPAQLTRQTRDCSTEKGDLVFARARELLVTLRREQARPGHYSTHLATPYSSYRRSERTRPAEGTASPVKQSRRALADVTRSPDPRSGTRTLAQPSSPPPE
jgi:hypothetical protein